MFFLSLFESFKEARTYPSVVLLHDPPVSQARLPSLNGFVPFFPPVRKPRVASYVHRSFLASFSVLPRFTEKADIFSLDVSSQKPLFASHFLSFRLVNVYSINSADRRVHSAPPEPLFPAIGIPLLVAGDLNIHNPLADPLPSFSSQEASFSTPYFQLAALGGIALLNSPGVYTRVPLSRKTPPSPGRHPPPLSLWLSRTPFSYLLSKVGRPASPRLALTMSP